LPAFPPYITHLKIGVSIILLENINPLRFYDRTRLAVKKLLNNIIETTILNEKFYGGDVVIPRIPMIPTDMLFQFIRLQFTIIFAFLIYITKLNRYKYVNWI